MTSGWVFFGVVMPAIVTAIGWIGVFAHGVWLRRNDEARAREAKLAE